MRYLKWLWISTYKITIVLTGVKEQICNIDPGKRASTLGTQGYDRNDYHIDGAVELEFGRCDSSVLHLKITPVRDIIHAL